MAHRRQWQAAVLGGGAPTITRHGCARGEHLHDQGVTGQSEEGTEELRTSTTTAGFSLGCAPVMAATVDMPFPSYL
jgi:hypothetical protein